MVFLIFYLFFYFFVSNLANPAHPLGCVPLERGFLIYRSSLGSGASFKSFEAMNDWHRFCKRMCSFLWRNQCLIGLAVAFIHQRVFLSDLGWVDAIFIVKQ